MPSTYKLLPVVSDYCTGCRICVDACEHDCLGMVWDFSTLQHPDLCHSDGVCMQACPEDAIRMEWTESPGPHTTGEWREQTDLPATDRSPGFLARLFGKRF